MGQRLQKTTNFFYSDPDVHLDDMKSGDFDAPKKKWVWTEDEVWKDQLSGRIIMKVEGDMELIHLGGRRYQIQLPDVKQYVRGHRFVYKLDAFTKKGLDQLGNYLFTIVTPRFRYVVDQFGVESTLSVEGVVPPGLITDPGHWANILWVRRGAGEWRD